VREPLTAFLYQQNYQISKQLHAVERNRRLFSKALDYRLPSSYPQLGLKLCADDQAMDAQRRIVFLYGTTWRSKHYPEQLWKEMAAMLVQAGFSVALPWSNEKEHMIARAIAGDCEAVQLLPRMNLTELARVIAAAAGVVAVDTGLAHLVGGLGVPSVILYGPTNPNLTGVIGSRLENLAVEKPCAPCMKKRCSDPHAANGNPVCFHTLPPKKVVEQLQQLMTNSVSAEWMGSCKVKEARQ
jgi:heptosyltransferase-1